MPKRRDLGDERDPNPTKGQDYQQPELESERIEGRDFADSNFAADQRRQGRERADAASAGGSRTDDVQASDRGGESALLEGEAGDADRARRVNAARTGLDAERRAETDENL